MTGAGQHQPGTRRRAAPWQILLGVIVLFTLIALIAKACGDDDKSTPIGGTSGGTQSTPTSTAPAANPQRVAAAMNAQVRRRGVAWTTGASDLTDQSKATLDIVATILQRNPTVRVQVQGYTDNVGTPARNLALSQRRAQAVVDYLVTKGVAAARLQAQGFGQANPIASNDTEQGRIQNRRVEFAAIS